MSLAKKNKDFLTQGTDITYLYENILGRSPENNQVILNNLGKPYREVLAIFLNSPEFKRRLQNSEPNDVVLETSDEELSLLLQKTTNQWTALGNSKPYWSVLTDEKYNPENIDLNFESFWKTGESAINQVMDKLKILGLYRIFEVGA